MNKFFALILAVILCFGLFAGCAAPNVNTGNTRTITDGAGRQVEVPENVESIV